VGADRAAGPVPRSARHPADVRPGRRAAGAPLRHLPLHAGRGQARAGRARATYEEAAYTIGASRWQTFRYVILPALRGGLFSGLLLTFAHSLGEFGATVMVSGNLRLRTQTAPLYIFAQFEAGNIETANAVAAVLATDLLS
jgi:ABC-type sulfate transport system permease component